ncbi:MAG: hypothetical protein AB7O95_17175 [Geminicoccaceae bacterium]
MEHDQKRDVAELMMGVCNVLNIIVREMAGKGLISREKISSELRSLVENGSNEAIGSSPSPRLDLLLTRTLAEQLSFGPDEQAKAAGVKPILN